MIQYLGASEEHQNTHTQIENKNKIWMEVITKDDYVTLAESEETEKAGEKL